MEDEFLEKLSARMFAMSRFELKVSLVVFNCRIEVCLLFPFIFRIASQTCFIEEREFIEETYFFQEARLHSLIVRRVLARALRYLFKLSGVGRMLNCFNASRRCLMASLHSLVIQGFCGFLLFSEDLGIDSPAIEIKIEVKCCIGLTALNIVSVFNLGCMVCQGGVVPLTGGHVVLPE